MQDVQLGSVLGSGAFGSVHRGVVRGEEVAVKQMHLDGCQVSAEQLEEFKKEVATLQALRHPRLIRFIGVALELPTLCIITELAAGGSLHALLHVRKMPLTRSQRRELALQVTEGVVFLHSCQPPMVHRDLKSANVVLDRDLNAKLCDFGLTESMEKTHISRRESEGGSPRYMAPEVFDARRKLTEKLDTWALGCLVVELLAGVLPHSDCSTIQQVAQKLIVHARPPFEDSWAAGVHPEVHRLVSACFILDPSTRLSSLALFEGLSRLPNFYDEGSAALAPHALAAARR